MIKRITYDFFKFLIDISFLANKEMHHLNSLLAKHPSLANPENYKVLCRLIEVHPKGAVIIDNEAGSRPTDQQVFQHSA